MAITAYDFAGQINSGYGFGVDRKNVVSILRRLADRIECEEVHPQSARVVGLADREDFTRTVLRLVFTEKKINLVG